MKLFLCTAVLLLCLQHSLAANTTLPVVLWHGMGATTHTGGTSEIKKFIEEKLGTYVFSISTGGSDAEQTYSDFFGNIYDQVDDVCKLIAEKKELSAGYNAVGLSQGGLFLRAVVERCQHKGPKMRTLVTMGSPHQGVINIPLCTGLLESGVQSNSSWACQAMHALLSWGAYLPWVRNHVIQAQYFKDPYHIESYLAHNPFLPDLNNERLPRKPQHKANLASLAKLALFRFAGDFTVVPRDSAWFADITSGHLLPLRDTDLYKEDRLGLKELDTTGRLDFNTLPGFHMQFSYEEFEQLVIKQYLSGAADDSDAGRTAVEFVAQT